ncbi:hypothetical protein [Kitasatospora sp. NPDC088783]|uniref:hypothetical protein n=1 Tax=Kitasatospora sp. NPDC088783 TaxID=3364077 RepID=UPI003818A264
MTYDLPRWMSDALSEQRLAGYVETARGDVGRAMRLYWWNAEVSGAFLGPLQCLEVTLRNAVHNQLTSAFGRSDWWEAVLLNPYGRSRVANARDKRRRRSRVAVSADGIVSELPFGFWVSLLSAGDSYDRRLWVPHLHRAFPHYSGRRDSLHHEFDEIREFRNRISHHEPIHRQPLAADREKIYRLLGHLNPEMAAEAQSMDRVPEILDAYEETCAGVRLPRF